MSRTRPVFFCWKLTPRKSECSSVSGLAQNCLPPKTRANVQDITNLVGPLTLNLIPQTHCTTPTLFVHCGWLKTQYYSISLFHTISKIAIFHVMFEIPIWLVVWNIFSFSINWECHHRNWRSHIFQRDWSTTNQAFLANHPWSQAHAIPHDTLW